MISSLEKFFKKNNIMNYRIIEHIITESNLTIKPENSFELTRNKHFFIIMFANSMKVERVILPLCEDSVATDILQQLLVGELFWTNTPIKFLFDCPNEHFEPNKLSHNCIKNYKVHLVNIINIFLNENAFELIESSNQCVKHESIVYQGNGSFKQVHFEYSSMIHVINDKAEDKFIFGKANTIEKLVKIFNHNEGNLPPAESITSKTKLRGIIVIPSSIMELIYTMLINALFGQLINAGRSFIKAENFQNLLFSPYLTIKDDPYHYLYQDVHFDAEGSLLNNKYLIKEGVLLGCCNDLESASVLNLTAGNLFYDYNKNISMVQATTLVIETHKIIESNMVDIYIEGIYNGHFDMNIITGILSTSLYGIEINTGHRYEYTLNISLIDLLKSIIGGYGPIRQNPKFIMRDSVINFK